MTDGGARAVKVIYVYKMNNLLGPLVMSGSIFRLPNDLQLPAASKLNSIISLCRRD